MAQRVQLTQDVYMKVDNQWSIVLGGSVIDLAKDGAISPQHCTVLNEATGTLQTVNGVAVHTPVRNVKRK